MSPEVAIFTADMDGGGAERAMAKLASGIAARGYAVDLVLTRAVGHHLADVSRDVRVVDLAAGRVLTSLPALVRYLRRERPRALLTSLAHVNIVGLWSRRAAGVPMRLVLNEQNTYSLETTHSTRRRHRLLPLLARRFYPWADAIVAVSRGAADDLATTLRMPSTKIGVAHNPIVTPQLRAQSEEPVIHPWFASSVPVVVAVGRFTPQKDFPTLLRAFAKVRARREARLMIIGAGPEGERLDALASELGVADHVAFPGWITNPYPYLARSRAFVLSSRWEGLPSVLIEALYCGVPIVATECPSGPEEILEGGRHGALVPVGDVGALAARIDDALDGTIPPPSPESWQPYELDTVVDRYLELLLNGAR